MPDDKIRSKSQHRKKPKKSKKTFLEKLRNKLTHGKWDDEIVDILEPQEEPWESTINLSVLEAEEGKAQEGQEKRASVAAKIKQLHQGSGKGLGKPSTPTLQQGEELDKEPMFLYLPYEFKTDYNARHVANLPLPTPLRRDELNLYFRRGFRPDNLSLDNQVCFLPSLHPKMITPKKFGLSSPVIYFSDHEEPIDFLVSLGFNVDEAGTILKQEGLKQRIYAALSEARIWVKYMTLEQGTLILLLSQVIKSKIMRFFLQLVEAIVNQRITNASKLDAFLRTLEKVDSGGIKLVPEGALPQRTSGIDIADRNVKRVYRDILTIAKEESHFIRGSPLSEDEICLLQYVSLKYRPALHNHLPLLARYIGQGLVKTQMQVDAAMLYLTRAENAEVDINDFEGFCGFTEDLTTREKMDSMSVLHLDK